MSKEKTNSAMSAQERSQRRGLVGKAASEKVAKSEQLNFRIEEQTIKELQNIALHQGLPVGTMIRDWVLERLSQEKIGRPDAAGKALRILDEIHVKLNYLFGPSR
jgi:predicted DNA binding CopG/RHH family protein